MDRLRWGILATGRITPKLVEGIRASETGKLVAVGSRTQQSADKWAKEHGALYSHGSYKDLLNNEEVDVIYIASPNSEHMRHVILAAEAKKHILCEKPFASNVGEAVEAIECCRRNGVFMLEAFAWRSHPSTKHLVELIKKNVIGKVKIISASFGFNLHGQPENTMMSNLLSGGSIMDVGCYPVSMAQLIAGAAMGRDFIEPKDLQASGFVGETGVDQWLVQQCNLVMVSLQT